MRLPSIRNLLNAAIGCTLLFMAFSAKRMWRSYRDRPVLSEPDLSLHSVQSDAPTHCPSTQFGELTRVWPLSRFKLKPRSSILFLSEAAETPLQKAFVSLMTAAKFKFHVVPMRKNGLPYLTRADMGKFAVIIFERADSYAKLDEWNRQLLETYCREFAAGVIAFSGEGNNLELRVDSVTVVRPHGKVTAKSFTTGSSADGVLRLFKENLTLSSMQHEIPDNGWFSLTSTSKSCSPISFVRDEKGDDMASSLYCPNTAPRTIVIGGDLSLWPNKLILFDAISFLSNNVHSVPLPHYVQVDIDDIFVSPLNTRLLPWDVAYLRRAQVDLAKLIPNFKFNLGYTGHFFHVGDQNHDTADDLLLEYKKEFEWFPHSFTHSKAHTLNRTELDVENRKARDFAKLHGIPTDFTYSVSPFHSGVYPVHEPLYESWHSVFNIKTTSTYHYTRLYPIQERRGFHYRDVNVLPRYSLDLNTKTNLWTDIRGGVRKYRASLAGGDLFISALLQPISVWMTHHSNYALDRLAPYALLTLYNHLTCWTNVKLNWVPPTELGRLYFELNPLEKNPIWMNPCEEKQTRMLWAGSCGSIPDLLIVGPQKTGSTALGMFLSLHPNVVKNTPSVEHREELQFFSGDDYYKGLPSYLSHFPSVRDNSTQIVFEKSATYFQSPKSVKRVGYMKPAIKGIVVLLMDPAQRAYSWYHHNRATGNLVAHNYTFLEVISSGDDASAPLKHLKGRCLDPGYYRANLNEWFKVFPTKQVLLVDSDEFRHQPSVTMKQLETFLGLPHFDYQLEFNDGKGFFCSRLSKCLGASKGRQYPPMEEKAKQLLMELYSSENRKLGTMLKKLGYSVPLWLLRAISAVGPDVTPEKLQVNAVN